jgi:hypothetical protein
MALFCEKGCPCLFVSTRTPGHCRLITMLISVACQQLCLISRGVLVRCAVSRYHCWTHGWERCGLAGGTRGVAAASSPSTQSGAVIVIVNPPPVPHPLSMIHRRVALAIGFKVHHWVSANARGRCADNGACLGLVAVALRRSTSQETNAQAIRLLVQITGLSNTFEEYSRRRLSCVRKR